jgi:hypothetical protein
VTNSPILNEYYYHFNDTSCNQEPSEADTFPVDHQLEESNSIDSDSSGDGLEDLLKVCEQYIAENGAGTSTIPLDLENSINLYRMLQRTRAPLYFYDKVFHWAMKHCKKQYNLYCSINLFVAHPVKICG